MLQLRRATQADSLFLYLCNNDRGTREVSRRTGDITPEEHQRWLSARLEDPDCALYLIEVSGAPVGNLRLQRIETTSAVELSLALLPEARGREFGAQAIRLACQQLPAGVARVDAWIWEQNTASLRCFERCGFHRARELRVDDKLFFIYQHSAAPQQPEHLAES